MRARLSIVAVLAAGLSIGGVARAAGADATVASSAFTPVSPARVVDTRSGSPIPANTPRDFQITGSVVPDTASAVMINVTATRSQAGGWLQVLPTGRATIGTSSTLNLDEAGKDTPNASFAPLGDGGRLTVYATFTTDVIIDVFGYFTPTASSAGGRLVPLTPSRILDTRNSIGWTPPAPPPSPQPPAPQPPSPQPPAPGRPPNPGNSKNCKDFLNYAAAKTWFDTYYPYYGDVANLDADHDGIPCESLPGAPKKTVLALAAVPTDTTITLQVAGRGGVPGTGASAVVLNVTAADPQADGWVQVAPTPVRVGASSNLNTTKGRTVANLVVVPLSAAGTIDLYTNVGADLLADVVGYFTDASAPAATAGLFVPIAPSRELDTRQSSPLPLAAGSTVTIDVGDVSSSAIAIAGNVTAAAGAAGGWVQVAAPPLAVGASSNLNIAYDGQTVANALVSPVSSSQVAAYTVGRAHLLLDVTGWFTQAA